MTDRIFAHLPDRRFASEKAIKWFWSQIFYKNPESESRVNEDTSFSGLTCPIWGKQDFFQKTLNIIHMYLSAPFIAKIFKKSLEQTQSYEYVFSGPEWPNCPEW